LVFDFLVLGRWLNRPLFNFISPTLQLSPIQFNTSRPFIYLIIFKFLVAIVSPAIFGNWKPPVFLLTLVLIRCCSARYELTLVSKKSELRWTADPPFTCSHIGQHHRGLSGLYRCHHRRKPSQYPCFIAQRRQFATQENWMRLARTLTGI